jgi:hypothetical protein
MYSDFNTSIGQTSNVERIVQILGSGWINCEDTMIPIIPSSTTHLLGGLPAHLIPFEKPSRLYTLLDIIQHSGSELAMIDIVLN